MTIVNASQQIGRSLRSFHETVGTAGTDDAVQFTPNSLGVHVAGEFPENVGGATGKIRSSTLDELIHTIHCDQTI